MTEERRGCEPAESDEHEELTEQFHAGWAGTRYAPAVEVEPPPPEELADAAPDDPALEVEVDVEAAAAVDDAPPLLPEEASVSFFAAAL